MNSIKLTDALLCALVILLTIHVGLEIFRPVGRYSWHKDATSTFCVLDTAKGKVYGFQGDMESGLVVDVVDLAKNINDKSALKFSKKKPADSPGTNPER